MKVMKIKYENYMKNDNNECNEENDNVYEIMKVIINEMMMNNESVKIM